MLEPLLQPNTPSERRYLTITQLNHMSKVALERHVGDVWVTGELSGFKAQHASGHWYFSLKDDKSQIACAMFKGRNRQVHFQPEDGQKLLIKAKVTLYEPRGSYQLIVERMEPDGLGSLQIQFEQLKKRLSEEGLFDAESKKELPELPKTVALVTSPSGAVIRDVITVMKRRFPLTDIIVYPVQVQGAQAHTHIIQAIEQINQTHRCDLILLARGGGSLEDLWCFNEESLAYAIYHSELPIISAIGHETDFTIADFVADKRAPTPSAAAEMITPDSEQLCQMLDHYLENLLMHITDYLENAATQIYTLSLQINDPSNLLKLYQEKLQRHYHTLLSRHSHILYEKTQRLSELQQRLIQQEPKLLLTKFFTEHHHLTQRLAKSMVYYLQKQQQRLLSNSRQLHAISPLATLERGYSITKKNNQVVYSIKHVNEGDTLETQTSDGVIMSQVTSLDDLDSLDNTTQNPLKKPIATNNTNND